MGDKALPCICCGKELDNFAADHDNQPLKGTEFKGGGEYGSAVTDHPAGFIFVVNVCDECVLEGIEKKTVGKIRR